MIKKLNFILLLVLSLAYLFFAFKFGRPLRQTVKKEPILEQYMTDMNCYLKTYYLIEKKIPFYQAYALAEKGDAGSDSFPGEIWGWKTPFLFYLWKFMPGIDGRGIYWLFVAIILSVPWISFLIGSELAGEKYGFLSSLFVWPYFLLPLKEITFIQVEWWGLIFFLWGFYFLIKNKLFFASFFMTLTIFSRELFIVHLFFISLVLFFSKKKKAFLAVFIPFFILAAFYLLIHIPQVGRYEILENFDWTRSQGKTINWIGIQKTLAFNSANYYFLTRFFPFRISLLASTFSLFYLSWPLKKIKYFLALASFLPFFFIQFKPGIMSGYHDYWGIYYVPLTLLFLPSAILILKRLIKK